FLSPRLSAQATAATFAVTLAPADGGGRQVPIVRADSVLLDARWLEALRAGLPVRLRYRVELWRTRSGWFDAFERDAEWDVVVQHEPVLDQYTLLTVSGRQRRE